MVTETFILTLACENSMFRSKFRLNSPPETRLEFTEIWCRKPSLAHWAYHHKRLIMQNKYLWVYFCQTSNINR